MLVLPGLALNLAVLVFTFAGDAPATSSILDSEAVN